MELVQELGRGATGRAALYRNAGKLVVVKRIVARTVRDRESVRRELQFFRFVATLQRSLPKAAKHFTQLLAYKHKNTRHELTMTFAGNTLKTLWTKDKPTHVKTVVLNTLLIVDTAWRAGYILCDAHWGNLCWDGKRVVLIDYGEIRFVPKSQRASDYRYANRTDLMDVLMLGLLALGPVGNKDSLAALAQSEVRDTVRGLYVAVHAPRFRAAATDRLSRPIVPGPPTGAPENDLLVPMLLAIWAAYDPVDYCTSLGLSKYHLDDRGYLRRILRAWASKKELAA